MSNMKCNLPSIGWVKKALSKLGIVSDFSYCAYTCEPSLSLTAEYQKVSGFTELVAPYKVLHQDGDFTALSYGIFEWHLERIYMNGDQNPSDPPVKIYIEVRKNGIHVFNRDAPMGSANNPNEPSVSTYSSPFIFNVEKGDIFNFWFKGEDGVGVDPQDVKLIRVQMIANKIHNR
jgi:hypothetical protein